MDPREIGCLLVYGGFNVMRAFSDTLHFVNKRN